MQVIAYADDLALVAKNKRVLTEKLTMISTEAEKRGLEINRVKTKYMKIGGKENGSQNGEVTMGKFKFEAVENFRYLGCNINRQNQRRTEIEQRIQAGYRAYNIYKQYMKNKKISRGLKLKYIRQKLDL